MPVTFAAIKCPAEFGYKPGGNRLKRTILYFPNEIFSIHVSASGYQ